MASSGIVKSVLSGDTLIVRGRPVKGPPPERMLTLSNATAPRFGGRDQADEPFAFASREFLRKLLVGKEVRFRVDSKAPSGREYATVMLGEQNVLHLALKEGFLRLRSAGTKAGEQSEDQEELAAMESLAQAEGKGVWTKDPKAVEAARHAVMQYQLEGVDLQQLVNQFKRVPVPAIVENVRDGTSLRVLLLPTMQVVNFFLSGIRAPSVRKENSATQDGSNESLASVPFAEEAKYFTESRLHQREVKVILEGVSNNALVGSVLHPAGNIAEALVSSGLAKCVDWSILMVTGGPQRLREAEQAAKEKRLKLWKTFEPQDKGNLGAETEFDGIVTRIWNGDTLSIQSSTTNVEYKIGLSSIRQPKSKDPKESYYANEAKEFLRSRLIGKRVHVVVEYIRAPSDGFDERTCATVTMNNINMAEALLNKGLAAVIRHRKDDENRSRHYDSLMLAEDKAIKGKKGMFSEGEAPVVRLVDASENAAKARTYLSFFKRAGRVPAVVDFVSSGSRFKVLVPKENCKMTLALVGVRCPRYGKDSSDPFGQEAYDFTNKKCFQRNVEIEIENVDKAGGFIGTVWLPHNENLSVSLLEEGLATVHSFSADSSSHTTQLYAAENRARSNRKNLWTLEMEASNENEDDVDNTPEVVRDVIVTEIVDGGHFYMQFVDGEEARTLDRLMKELNVTGNLVGAPLIPKVGDLVSAEFSEDQKQYRAKVRKVYSDKKEVEVFYVDYGNSEILPFHKLHSLPSSLSGVKQQAQEAELSLLIVPKMDEDYGIEAAEYFKTLVNRPRLKGVVNYRQGAISFVTLYSDVPKSNGSNSLNAEMIRNGYAQVSKKVPKKFLELASQWKTFQDHARSRRLGMFEYGDYALEEEN